MVTSLAMAEPTAMICGMAMPCSRSVQREPQHLHACGEVLTPLNVFELEGYALVVRHHQGYAQLVQRCGDPQVTQLLARTDLLDAREVYRPRSRMDLEHQHRELAVHDAAARDEGTILQHSIQEDSLQELRAH